MTRCYNGEIIVSWSIFRTDSWIWILNSVWTSWKFLALKVLSCSTDWSITRGVNVSPLSHCLFLWSRSWPGRSTCATLSSSFVTLSTSCLFSFCPVGRWVLTVSRLPVRGDTPLQLTHCWGSWVWRRYLDRLGPESSRGYRGSWGWDGPGGLTVPLDVPQTRLGG